MDLLLKNIALNAVNEDTAAAAPVMIATTSVITITAVGGYFFPLAVYLAEAGDDSVIGNLLARHPEAGVLVARAGIYLVETVFVAEGGDALYGVQLALCVLFFKIIRVVSHIKNSNSYCPSSQ